MNADGALVELEQVEHLVDRLEGIDGGGVVGVHVKGVGGHKPASALCGVAILDAKILHAEPADGRSHPAVLPPMIVDSAGLADLPADSHALEQVVLEDQIASVVPLGKEEVGFERFRLDAVGGQECLHALERELPRRNRGQPLHPIVNRQHLRHSSSLRLPSPWLRSDGQIIASRLFGESNLR